MDEIGEEFNNTSGDDDAVEEPSELTSEFDKPDEFGNDIPETFSEPDEFDDDIPETFSEPDEFDDDIPEVFSEPDEFDDDIPEVFSEPGEFDDDIPEVFSEPGEFDDDIPEVFSEPDEFDDILDDTIHDKEVGEQAEEDQDSGEVGKVVENENIDPQSTSTVLSSEIEEIEGEMEHQEQEGEIEIRPEEYQDDTEPILNTDESEFIKDVEELAEYARETKGEDESVEPHAEQENAAYYAEQYYEKIKEKEVLNEQNSKEEQETEELMQEVAEEFKGDQESNYKSDELEMEDISEASKEITSTEEFEYLWEVRDKLDREGKSPEETEEVMHKAEEMYETFKNAEKLYEEQELEKLKLVDHEDEASEEDLKEQLDGMDLIERIVQLEEGLVQQMVLQEEIDVSVEEAIEGTIETAEFEEKVEKLIEEQDLKEEVRVEPFIKEALETEPESIVNEKEIEKLQEMDVEEQFQTVRLNDYVGELVERQEEEAEQLKEQEEKEELEAQANKIKEANSALYELVEVERDMLDQHEVEATIEEALETEPESIVNEKEIEKLQEMDIEEQFQTVRLNDYVEDLVLVERQEEDKNIENDKIEQEKENIEQTQDVIHQSTYLQEKLEEQEQELEWEYEEKDIVEQHQVKAAIEEELKTEPKPIINEEELECIKNSEPEKQLEAELFYEFIEELANKQNEEEEEREENEEQEEISTEQKVAQIMRELDIHQEINSGETEVESNSQKGELELETTSLDEEMVEQLEIEERRDQQQELEEIFEQNRKIEQEALKEIESGEEDSDKTAEKYYEKTKKLYTQQTEKRPIYANKETKGFKQWLEQKKKSEEKEKTKQKQELKEEQKKEEDWKTTLKEWIKEASQEECNAELKSELKKALERYNEFEDLARKFLELREKSQYEKLSEKEKNRLKSLTEKIQELDPIKLELLLSVFFIKKYIIEQYGDDFRNTPLVNRVLSKFFKHISEKYKNLKKAQENKEKSEEMIRNWIEQASEGEISPKLKVKLKEIVENKENLEVIKLELDAIEIDSEDKKDLLEEITKLRSEESDEEKSEHLQELYRQETGRSPIYARKKTKGYSQWLEQRELGAEKIKSSKSESGKKKEIEEEGWKTTLKQWIKEASEEECNAELKSELKKALESYDEFEDLTRKFLELYEKSQHEKLSEKENNRLKSLIERLQELGPIQLELLANIRAFKDYFNNNLWQLMNRFFVNRVRSKFFKHISQEYNRVILEYEDFKYTKQEINLRENNNTFEEKLQFNKSEIKVPNQEKALIREEDSAGIPIQRIFEKINNHKENIENDFYFKKSFPLFPTSKVTLTPHKQSSVGRKKNISIDINNLNFHNLLDELLLKSYEEFYIEHFALKVKNPYANTGRTLRAVFINWIKERYSNDNPKKDILLEKINIINENEEIAQYILYLLINSNVTQIGLNSILLKFHLNVSRETVRKIAEKNFTNEDYKKKFSKGDGWNKFSLQNSENYKKLIFSSLLNIELHKFFEQYYKSTSSYANFGKKITNDFINWIKQENIIASKKKDIFELIENINKNKEILNYIIYQVKKYINSNNPNKLPLKFFSEKFTPLFLKISDLAVGRVIKKNIFQNDINEFKEIFPVGYRKKEKTINLDNLNFDNLLDSSLIDKFRIYKELFFTSANHIYANHGMEITDDFIQWINLNESDFAKKEFLMLLCKKINENEEILSFIIDLTLTTNYNLSEIARELNLIHLNGQRTTIRTNVKEYVFNFDEEKYEKRFQSSDIISQTGISTHSCINSLVSLFFNNDSSNIYKYYSEIHMFPPSDKRADGFFLNIKLPRFFYDRLTKFTDSEVLMKTLNIKKALLNKIIGVQIEFTSDLSDENILKKCIKYQNKLILLIIVGTNWKNKDTNRQFVPHYSEILYPDRVLVISPRLFIKLLNLNSYFIQEFYKILEYSKNSNIESLEQYNNNICHKITFYNTNDLIKDVSLQFFENYFYNPEPELNRLEIPHIFLKFLSYCKNNFSSLEFKTITRGSSIGTYYIFDTLHLKQFNSQIDMSYNLISLADILGNYIGQDKIFFKKITKPNSDDNLRDKRRSILIESSFLDNYQEEF